MNVLATYAQKLHIILLVADVQEADSIVAFRKGDPGILGLRSRCLGAKPLVYGLWQNKWLQCKPEAPWPRKLPIVGR